MFNKCPYSKGSKCHFLLGLIRAVGEKISPSTYLLIVCHKYINICLLQSLPILVVLDIGTNIFHLFLWIGMFTSLSTLGWFQWKDAIMSPWKLFPWEQWSVQCLFWTVGNKCIISKDINHVAKWPLMMSQIFVSIDLGCSLYHMLLDESTWWHQAIIWSIINSLRLTDAYVHQ